MSAVEIILTVLTAAGGTGVVVVGLSVWLGKVWADRISQTQQLLGQIDIDLRDKRIAVYKGLWQSTALLPKWPREPGVTYEQLFGLSKTLRTWYFEGGGMYLSRTTYRDAYAPLQDTLAGVLATHTTGAISDEHYDLIRTRCSTLRGALANDIESRREGPA